MSNALVRSGGRACAVGALVLSSSACSTPTKVTDAWRNPSYVSGPMKRLVIMGSNVDATTRHLVEDRFVADLADTGVQGAQSYAVLGEVLPDRGNRASRVHSRRL